LQDASIRHASFDGCCTFLRFFLGEAWERRSEAEDTVVGQGISGAAIRTTTATVAGIIAVTGFPVTGLR
jgi:hypothetical protein